MIGEIFKNGHTRLTQKQESASSAALILGITFFASALLGLIRDRSLAAIFGDSTELGVFFAANRLPNVIFNLLVVGTLSSALIPILTRYLKKGEEKEAFKITNSLLNLNLLIFAAISLLVILFARPLATAISLGKLSVSETLLLANLMKIALFSQLLLILSSFLTSILQTYKYFFVPALTPIVYNLGVIAGIYVLSPRLGIFAPAWGMVFGATLHLLIQIPLAKKLGYEPKANLNLRHEGVKEALSLLLPRTLGLAVSQISLLVDTSLAVFISAPSLIFFNFAQNLQNLPLNLFGVSMAQAILPTLSAQGDEKDLHDFKNTLIKSLNQTLFFIVPASVILIVLRVPMVRLAFGAAKFSWPATLKTAYTLAFLAVSLPAQGAVYLFSRAFYALRDTKTPLKIGLLSFVTNVASSILFVFFLGFGVWSLGLSFSLSSFLNASLLYLFLNKKVSGFGLETLLPQAIKIAYAALLSGLCLYLPIKALDRVVFDTTRTINLLILTGIAGVCGLAAYLFFSWLFKVEELRLIKSTAQKIFKNAG